MWGCDLCVVNSAARRLRVTELAQAFGCMLSVCVLKTPALLLLFESYRITSLDFFTCVSVLVAVAASIMHDERCRQDPAHIKACGWGTFF